MMFTVRDLAGSVTSGSPVPHLLGVLIAIKPGLRRQASAVYNDPTHGWIILPGRYFPMLRLLPLLDILLSAVCTVSVFALGVRLFWRRGMKP
jgi:hypothetical protein